MTNDDTNNDKTPALRILIVDDLSVHRTLLRSGLQQLNPFLQIDVADNVAQAKGILERLRVDAIICDWKMPGGGGDTLLHWIRMRPMYKYVPFIMISGQDEREDIIRAFVELGVDNYITKPFIPSMVYEKLIRAVNKHRSLRTKYGTKQ